MRKKHWRAVVGSLLLAAVVVGAGPAGAQSGRSGDCRVFAETGKQVCGRFLAYWDTHGGLVQQGYPISGEFVEKSDTDGKNYAVQYFERAVFEHHTENAAPNDVLLQLLGAFLYRQNYPSGAPDQSAIRQETSQAYGGINTGHFRRFPRTGHTISGLFLDYWDQHGGLAQQGYPISDQFMEKSKLDGKTYIVQYFERAVFEYHPENKMPYNVLLSQLGSYRLSQKYSAGQPTPAATPGDVWDSLARRPLKLPSLPPTGKCPANQGKTVSADYGFALGDGPVYPVGFGEEGKVDMAGALRDPGGFYIKVLWVARPEVNQPVLVRGRQLNGSGQSPVLFGEGTKPAESLRLDVTQAAGSGSGWHEWPTYTRLRGSGCYAYQIDSPGFSTVITFWAILTMP